MSGMNASGNGTPNAISPNQVKAARGLLGLEFSISSSQRAAFQSGR